MAKGFNYLGLDGLATALFGCLMFIWTCVSSPLLTITFHVRLTPSPRHSYFRIYLSAFTLYSVWYQFDLIPSHTREWAPSQGWWLVPWMRYQIFAPLAILLALNCFWYALMWRVMIR